MHVNIGTTAETASAPSDDFIHANAMEQNRAWRIKQLDSMLTLTARQLAVSRTPSDLIALMVDTRTALYSERSPFITIPKAIMSFLSDIVSRTS